MEKLISGVRRLLVTQEVTFRHLLVRIPLRSSFVGVRQPPPLLSLVNTKVTWYFNTVKKVRIPIAFSELLKMLKWRFCYFCGIFWRIFACALCFPSIHIFIFFEMKVLRWYICDVSFIYIWLVISDFSYFRCFRTSRKYQFRLLLSDFVDITSRNVVKLVWNFD